MGGAGCDLVKNRSEVRFDHTRDKVAELAKRGNGLFVNVQKEGKWRCPVKRKVRIVVWWEKMVA